MKRTLLIAGIASLLCLSQADAWAQRKKKNDPPPPPTATADTTKKAPTKPPANPKDPKPYREVITKDAESDKGLFTVHKVKDNYYFEIPNDILGRDILVVNRVSKAAAGVRGGAAYAGDQINELVISFDRGPEDKIFLRKISNSETSSDSANMYWNLHNSSLQSIANAFDIKAFGKDSNSTVIDVTAFIKGDNDILFFNDRAKRSAGFTALQADKSYITSVNSYPLNIEIKSVKTYNYSAPSRPGAAPSGGSQPVTLELNSSMVVLPKEVMQSRYFDERVGYFTTQNITDFDLNPQGVKRYRFIKRFNLQPKPEDMAKYKAGQLVEPAKQIIYYIDPTTPKKWIPYLMQGVNDWSKAFEAAGFKNAVVGKMAPTKDEDSTWSLEDARHNAIVYKPSDIANASGPSVIDPRSGEIIETHVNWYHNVMSLVRNWYLIQTAAVDPGARKPELDDDLMGQLIRFVSSHEVGHTLGLRHNFGSSSTVPVENLRNKAWVEANGHTPSIMDYARFNYVAQPEDNISRVGLFPRIGDYDLWAIEWGYKLFPQFKNAEEEKSFINTWTINRMSANSRLWWGDGEGYGDDPRAQTEDLSDNSIKASDYGIKNLKRIVPQLPTYAMEPGNDYSTLGEFYNNAVGQYSRYIGHVSRHIGGIPRTSQRMGQTGSIYGYTDKAEQKASVKWLNDNVFTTQEWLTPSYATELLGISPQQTISSIQDRGLAVVTSPNTLRKLIEFEAAEGAAKAYTPNELLNDVRTSIFSEISSRKTIDIFRRDLQKKFVDKIINLANPPSPAGASALVQQFGGGGGSTNNTDISSVAKAQLRILLSQLSSASSYPDLNSRYHLQDLQARIKSALDPK